MTKTTGTPTAPRKADGIFTTQINNQIFIVKVFFYHGSKETSGDKLVKTILAEHTEQISEH